MNRKRTRRWKQAGPCGCIADVLHGSRADSRLRTARGPQTQKRLGTLSCALCGSDQKLRKMSRFFSIFQRDSYKLIDGQSFGDPRPPQPPYGYRASGRRWRGSWRPRAAASRGGTRRSPAGLRPDSLDAPRFFSPFSLSLRTSCLRTEEKKAAALILSVKI